MLASNNCDEESPPYRPVAGRIRRGRFGQAEGEEGLRPSGFLNAVEVGEGNSLLYNGFSMCIDVVTSEIARKLVSFKPGGNLSFLMPAEKEYLIKRGHLTRFSIKEEQEELSKLVQVIAERDADLNKRALLGKMLTFILTYKCNLACTYCFQDNIRQTQPHSVMSESFVDDFFRNYFGKLFPDIPGNRLRFILFGGEPMLPGNRGAIELILAYAQKQGIVVSTATNALMLPQMLDLLGPQPGKINNVQVTLDGGQLFHDATRISPSGAPTFAKMIGALHNIVEAKSTAIIRIHLHPDRLESTRELVEYLVQENILGHQGIEVYFAPVHSFHAKDISPTEMDIFSQLFMDVAIKQQKPPIQSFDFLEQIMNVKTTRNWWQPRYCAVSSNSHYAVDFLGDIYECLEEAGDRQKRIGTLSGGEVRYFELRDTYRNRYLANMPECLKCSIALFCGGGCISKTRTQQGSVFAQFCRQNKYFVAQTLKAFYMLKHAGNTGAASEPVGQLCSP